MNIFKSIFEKIQTKYWLWQYRNYTYDNKEDCGMIHIWGIKSWDDLTNAECGIHTMNDFDITYLKKKKKYIMGVETIYEFENSRKAEKEYIIKIFNRLTEWMKSQGYKTDDEFSLYEVFTYNMNNLCCGSEFDTIEDLYKTFKFFVKGFVGETISDK